MNLSQVIGAAEGLLYSPNKQWLKKKKKVLSELALQQFPGLLYNVHNFYNIFYSSSLFRGLTLQHEVVKKGLELIIKYYTLCPCHKLIQPEMAMR